MQPVIETPGLPQPVGRHQQGIFGWAESLVKRLTSIMQERGFRLNRLVPKDGSEDTDFVSLVEIADPDAPAADKARLYVKDNGAGKTQLVVRFPTGAVQVLSTEP